MKLIFNLSEKSVRVALSMMDVNQRRCFSGADTGTIKRL